MFAFQTLEEENNILEFEKYLASAFNEPVPTRETSKLLGKVEIIQPNVVQNTQPFPPLSIRALKDLDQHINIQGILLNVQTPDILHDIFREENLELCRGSRLHNEVITDPTWLLSCISLQPKILQRVPSDILSVLLLENEDVESVSFLLSAFYEALTFAPARRVLETAKTMLSKLVNDATRIRHTALRILAGISNLIGTNFLKDENIQQILALLLVPPQDNGLQVSYFEMSEEDWDIARRNIACNAIALRKHATSDNPPNNFDIIIKSDLYVPLTRTAQSRVFCKIANTIIVLLSFLRDVTPEELDITSCLIKAAIFEESSLISAAFFMGLFVDTTRLDNISRNCRNDLEQDNLTKCNVDDASNRSKNCIQYSSFQQVMLNFALQFHIRPAILDYYLCHLQEAPSELLQCLYSYSEYFLSHICISDYDGGNNSTKTLTYMHINTITSLFIGVMVAPVQSMHVNAQEFSNRLASVIGSPRKGIELLKSMRMYEIHSNALAELGFLPPLPTVEQLSWWLICDNQDIVRHVLDGCPKQILISILACFSEGMKSCVMVAAEMLQVRAEIAARKAHGFRPTLHDENSEENLNDSFSSSGNEQKLRLQSCTQILQQWLLHQCRARPSNMSTVLILLESESVAPHVRTALETCMTSTCNKATFTLADRKSFSYTDMPKLFKHSENTSSRCSIEDTFHLLKELAGDIPKLKWIKYFSSVLRFINSCNNYDQMMVLLSQIQNYQQQQHMAKDILERFDALASRAVQRCTKVRV